MNSIKMFRPILIRAVSITVFCLIYLALTGAESEQPDQIRNELKNFRLMAPKERAAYLKKLNVREIETITYTGDPSNRLDIVFLSDGFTEKDLKSYQTLVKRCAQDIVKQDPFCAYEGYVNIHRVDVIGEKSGVDESGDGPCGARRFGDMLISDFGKASRFARLAPDFDVIVVIANVRNIRATGSYSGFYSDRPGMVSLDMGGGYRATLKHELGHAWGSLADEYEEAAQTTQHPLRDITAPNVSLTGNVRKAPWHYFNEPFSNKKTVGTVEGCYYHSKGAWRAAPACTMRCNGKDFCPVCAETMELRFYMVIDVIDDVMPREDTIGIFENEEKEFTVKTLLLPAKEIGGAFCLKWAVDGKLEKGKILSAKNNVATQKYKGRDLGPGSHQVTTALDFINIRVVRDRGLMSSVRNWTVNVFPGDAPKIEAPKKVDVKKGEKVEFTVKLVGEYPQDRLKFDVLVPDGFLYDTGAATVRYDGDATGAFQVVCRLAGQGYLNEVAVPVTIDPGVARPRIKNVPPKVVYALEGSELVLDLEADDADNDRLLYSATPLPYGAEIDNRTGKFVWTPGPNDAGKYNLTFGVTDGKGTAKAQTGIVVQDGGSTAGIPADAGSWQKRRKELASLSLDQMVRKSASSFRMKAAQMVDGKTYPAYSLLVCLKLLRDHDEAVSRAAAESLQKIMTEADQETKLKLLGLFLDDLNDTRVQKRHFRKVWQVIDKPWAMELVGTLAKLAADTGDKSLRKDLASLKTELDAIQKYQKWQEMQ